MISQKMDKFTEATIATYNRTAELYAKNVADLHHTDEAEIFLGYLPENSPILDLGCGSGRDAGIFSGKGYRVMGVDLSDKMLETARREAPSAKFRQMDIRKLELNNETFGGIWSVASLLHVPKADIPQCLRECYRVLRTGGIIYIGVKSGKGEEFQPDLRYAPDAMKFYSFFEPGELEGFMERAGFEVIRSKTQQPKTDYLKHNELHVFGQK